MSIAVVLFTGRPTACPATAVVTHLLCTKGALGAVRTCKGVGRPVGRAACPTMRACGLGSGDGPVPRALGGDGGGGRGGHGLAEGGGL
eukprot:scaffold84739_cov17-Tisochrysis_lutea.AAC.1